MQCRFILAKQDEPRLNPWEMARSDRCKRNGMRSVHLIKSVRSYLSCTGQQRYENLTNLVPWTLSRTRQRGMGRRASRRTTGKYQPEPDVAELRGHPAEHWFALRSTRCRQLRLLLGILPCRSGSDLQARTRRQQGCRRILHDRTCLHLQISGPLICEIRQVLH